MGKYIIVGSGDRSTRRLAADTNLDEEQVKLRRCMTDDNYAEFTVEMRDDPRTRGTLVLNGNALPFAALVELPDDIAGSIW